MKRSGFVCVLAAAVAHLSVACAVGPTEASIEDSLEKTLRSVDGAWSGTIGTNQATLAFTLAQSASGALTGSGTMKEANASSAVPITVTGSFQRPALSLTFNGMVFEGKTVQGSAQGNYTSVGGVMTQIRLVGTDYDRSLPLHLYEQ